MIFRRRNVTAFVLSFTFASAAFAQVCSESSADRTSTACDMTYRNTIVTCDPANPMLEKTKGGQTMTWGTRQSCPAKPMPMIDTPLKSFIKDYSPYVFAYPRDPKNPTQAYVGEYFRGAGGADQVFSMFGNATGPNGKKFAPCKLQLTVKGEIKTPEDQAKLVRLQLDNCSNQYILQSAMYPFQKDGSYQTSGENPQSPSERISVNTDCQPLKIVPIAVNEYNAATYIRAAWKKLLNDPTYRLNKNAKLEPSLPDGVKIENALPVPSDFPDDISLSTIGTVQTEEILDPSHPFTPRWDFERNERDFYSPKTASYSSDSKNAVFCAGNKDKDIIKVDILSFREKKLEFDKKVMDRINFNKNCWANQGLQKDPCCKVIITDWLNPFDPMRWQCRPMSCKECYKMTVEQPVCATNYASNRDKLKIRNFGYFPGRVLPINPVLRITNGLNNVTALAMSQLDANTPIGQVSSIVNGQLDVANVVAANAPIGQQLLPIMQGQSGLMQMATSTAKTMSMQQLSQVTGISANTLNSLGSSLTDPQQMRSLAKGQAMIVANTAGLGPVTSVASSLSSTQSMINAIPGARNVTQYIPYLNGQQGIVNTIKTQAPVAQALSGVRTYETMLSSAASGKTTQGLQTMLKQNGEVLAGYSKNMTVGNLKKNIGTQLGMLEKIAGTETLGDALKQLPVGADVGALANISKDVTVDNARSILGGHAAGLAAFADDETTANFIESVASQEENVLKMTVQSGGTAADVGAALSSVSGAYQDLSKVVPPGKIREAINGPLDAIKGMSGDLPIDAVREGVGQLNIGISGLNLNGLDLSDVSKVMGGVGDQMDGLLKTGLNTEELSKVIGEQSKMFNELSAKGLTKIGDAQKLFGDKVDAIGKLPATMKVQELAGSLNGQVNQLKNLPQLGQIGQFADDMDQQLMGAVGKVSDLRAGAMKEITKGMGDLNKLIDFPGIDPSTKLSELSSKINASVNKGLGKLTSGMSKTLGKVDDGIKKQTAQINNKINGAIQGTIKNVPGVAALSELNNKISQITPKPCAVPGSNNLFAWCVAIIPYKTEAKCTPNEFGASNEPAMASLCKDLRAPYTNLNKLKMRYHNPDDKQNMVLKEGVPEGYSFKDYFDDKETRVAHMPYPRLWDTGKSIQKVSQEDQDPNDKFGQYAAIVGVGREAAPDSAQAAPAPAPAAAAGAAASAPAPKKPSELHKDERCLFGGWGGDTNFAGVNIKVPDPVTSWSEIKLYQARSLRQHGLSCLARYEKSFKTGSTENQLTFTTGGAWDRMIVSTCPPNRPSSECKFESLSEYKARAGSGGTLNADDKVFMQSLPSGGPNAWRGYISSKNDSNRFPNFGKKASLIQGLDKAELGDIILMPKGAGKAGGKPGLAKLALVIDVNTPANGDCAANKNCYVRVLEFDNGKSPDVCGTTDTWGIAKNRTLYRPGNFPPGAKDAIAKLKWTDSCEESNLSDCELAPWDSLELYRIAEDERVVTCTKLKASECE